MSIIRKPFMQTGNAHLLPIDMNDPSLVLYLPLWYPHGDMTGSTIYSYDRNRHAGTVTGATWGTQGRTLNGADQYISVASHASFSFTNEVFTCITWVKITDLSTYPIILSKGEAANGYWWQVRNDGAVWFSTDSGASGAEQTKSAASAVSINNWYHLAVIKNGASVTLYKDCVDINGTSASHTDIGDNSASPLLIGVLGAGHTQDFTGINGEVRIYNRVFNIIELQSDRQSTKWRYT